RREVVGRDVVLAQHLVPGRRLPVRITRDGREQDVTVLVQKRPEGFGDQCTDLDLWLAPVRVGGQALKSPDGKTFTFYLRKGAKFHDGVKEVTAQDFKYSMERAANPKTESSVAELYLGDIVGVKEVLEGKATEISGIKVLDKYTLQINIDAPKAYFLAKLTYSTAFVVDKANVESDPKNWASHPNATGPFKLKEFKPGERLILERNDNFYRGVAKLAQVRFILSGGTAMAMYENSEIDLTGIGLADLDRVRDPKDPLSKELVTGPPSFDVSYIGFNTRKPPFDDVLVRQAFSLAVDKDLINRNVLSNLEVPAYGILPPGFPGYNADIKGLRYDPQRAKELIAQSKYKSAASFPRIIVTMPGTGGSPRLDLEAIMEMWKQNLGVKVELQQVEWATFLQDLNQRKFQVFALGWVADYPDPHDFLDILFHSKSVINHTGYSNPEVDRLLEEARSEPDVSKRLSLYQKAEETIVNDAPWLLLWFSGDRFVLIKPYVKGYAMVPLIIPRLKEVYIEGKP
ncbi:MAG: peptide ABC transporter substrate-binding protein, partial [Chloroflexota bacterium]|nr:peptide ABC transporter substrate-binding protein [Chloroflexota bacterium]